MIASRFLRHFSKCKALLNYSTTVQLREYRNICMYTCIKFFLTLNLLRWCCLRSVYWDLLTALALLCQSDYTDKMFTPLLFQDQYIPISNFTDAKSFSSSFATLLAQETLFLHIHIICVIQCQHASECSAHTTNKCTAKCLRLNSMCNKSHNDFHALFFKGTEQFKTILYCCVQQTIYIVSQSLT